MTKTQRGKAVDEIKTFMDLMVWQKSMALLTRLYRETNGFPAEEKFGLVSQMRRSAVSIPSNIAEGYGRRTSGDYLRFLQIAIGSVYELQTQLEISRNLTFMNEKKYTGLNDDLCEVERMLSSLAGKIRQGKPKRKE